jgi:hypothetical protein
VAIYSLDNHGSIPDRGIYIFLFTAMSKENLGTPTTGQWMPLAEG